MPRPRLRPALRWLHRWLGLTVGLVFTLVSISGSLLLFQPWFFTWAHGEMIPPNLSQEAGSIDRWVENARQAVPELHGPIAIWLPHVEHNVSDAGMLVFGGREPGGLGNMGFAGVLVAPATGAVLGVVDIDRSPAYAPLFLHRDLWAGVPGRIVSGIMALGSLVMLSLGLYLWWPPRRRLLRKLSPRPWRVTLSQAARLHDWTGIWTLFALLVLTVTGLYLAQPGWVGPALRLLPAAEAEEEHVTGACHGPIGFDAAIAAAQAIVPSGRLTAIYPHDQAMRYWEFAFRAVGDGDAQQGDAWVGADLQCGNIALVQTPETRSPRDVAETWLVTLHDGTAFGTTGEIAVSLLGLAPLLLAWTGIRMWLRRRRVVARKRDGDVAAGKRPQTNSQPSARTLT